MHKSTRLTLLGTALGNFFEWLDFTLYGFFSTAIALTFFPPGNPQLALLATIGAFASGFITRPLGAYFIGRYADAKGRKAALILTFMLMGGGTLLIAGAPSHASAGLLGALCVLLGRLLQGLAASGEYGAAAAMFIEVAPPGRKGLYGSLFIVSTYLALACGALLAVLVYSLLGAAATEAYGWRLAFVIGLCIVPFGLWLRAGMAESQAFSQARRQPRQAAAPIDWQAVLVVIGLTSLGTSSLYLSMIFMPAFAKAAFDIAVLDTSIATSLACLIVAASVVLGGHLSDRLGPALPMFGGLAVILLGGLPAFGVLLWHPGMGSILLFQGLNGVGLGLFVGASFSSVCNLFRTRQRALGLGLGYNLGVALFGALAPLVSTAALGYGIHYAPALYLLLTALISAAASRALLGRAPSSSTCETLP
ncbi:MFS transporter [Pseudomonas sp. Au-Pse12]|uniref:MFS transporter n=1 Tax=Pseudomonas sp. Au-Pse12 TaxID=2906459 RepID=UPI001E6531AE|nr:MFS transporter [Pseudomonas sp. Au-Pse12]MCE4057961.1 MFS transporter [Pseudomonas sp. Au-Pse12]